MSDPGPPFQAADPYDWAALLALIQRAFAYMDGRIDPPSSLQRLTPEGLAASGEVWVVGRPALACMVLNPEDGRLHLGKLAVEPALQGRGLGRRMMARAEERAWELGLSFVRLETRVELAENHRFYRALGYEEVGRRAHPGFDRPTSVSYEKRVRGRPDLDT